MASSHYKLLGGWRPIQANQEKRRIVRHPTTPPARFWDRLASVPLTYSALRELDTRKSAKSRHKRKRIAALRAKVKISTRNPMQDLDLSHLRAFPNPLYHDTEDRAKKLGLGPDGVKPRARKRAPRPEAKKILHYDAAFQQHLIQQGVYADPDDPGPHNYEPLPKNLDEIFDILDEVIGGLDDESESEQDEADYAEFLDLLKNKETSVPVLRDVVPRIEGRVADGGIAEANLRLTSLEHLTDGTLPAGHPDRFYGANANSVKDDVLNALFNYIAPNAHPLTPIAPNFFLEALGDDDDEDASLLQAIYHGMLGERGILKLRFHGVDGNTAHDEKPALLDGKAHTVVASYKSGQLEFRVLHAVPGPKGGWMYVSTQLYSFVMNTSAKNMFIGLEAYRALRRWAKKQRDEAIALANGDAAG
ncbi:hypothetical protein CDD82_1541 [Ophiocordyceps australis]|uniref:Uncharacterized protein n=1 Tax=Ophiocordyceps australis TaxID=1399860 RepID=A0A2C5XLS6_9HYPO|nr:hypothetical protein CDD82_1541 [Ophiocordyceps australis]